MTRSLKYCKERKLSTKTYADPSKNAKSSQLSLGFTFYVGGLIVKRVMNEENKRF